MSETSPGREPVMLRSTHLTPVRCFADDNDAVARLETTEPKLRHTIDALTDAVPIPPTVAAFTSASFCRPPTSARCFYFFLDIEDQSDVNAGSGVIAFKGLEPCAADFCDMLADFRRPGPSAHNIAEHFVYEERKVPGCLTLENALFEAERSSSYQGRHLAVYGEPAHAPVPLFVFRHADDVVARALEALRRHLSADAFRVVERELDRGLAAYVYYYPSLPIRVRDIDFLLHGVPFRERLLAVLCDVCNPDEIVEGWVRSFVHMLYSGFLPGSLASLRNGICCQPQNACIDGGFVDLDSLTRFDELVDDTAVLAALQFSVDALIDSVRTLIAGRVDAARGEDSAVRIDGHHFREYVLSRLRTAIEREARPGMPLDPRVSGYFTPAPEFGPLIERLSACYSRPSAFDREAWNFRTATPDLLRRARRRPPRGSSS
jgi:hypothetical protein